MPETSFSHAMLSDPGRVRQKNEDACAADPAHGIFVVCDGVGGAAGGEIASELASKTFLARLRAAREARSGAEHGMHPAEDAAADAHKEIESDLRDGFDFANRAVHVQSHERPELFGMATTMVAMLFEPHPGISDTAGTVWLANVGDSRCYRLRGKHLEQLTQDHSLVGEQVRSGLMTREEAEASPIRNVITRAVGSDIHVEADVQRLHTAHGDLFLLASDGLTRDLRDSDVAEVLMAGSGNLAGTLEQGLPTLCAELVCRANEKGGGDNITCLLVHIL